MIKLILISLTFLCSTTFFGKVKTKKMEIGVQKTQFPSTPLDASIKTFKSSVTSLEQSIWQRIFNRVDVEREYFNLQGYRRSNAAADVQIKVDIGYFKESKTEVEEALRKLKGGDGADNKKYRYKVTYNMPVSYSVIQQGGVIHKWGAGASRSIENKVFYSDYYNTKALASKARNQYIHAWRDDAKRTYLTGKFKQIYKDLNDRYGYKPVRDNMFFYHTNPKKNPEYDNLVDQVMEMKGYAGNIRAHALIPEATRSGIQSIIDLWKVAEQQYSFDDAETGALKEAYVSNIMNAAYIIEDMDLAQKYAQMLTTNKKSKRLGERGLEKIKKTLADFKRMGHDSRHIVFDAGAAGPVGEMTADDGVNVAIDAPILEGIPSDAPEAPTSTLNEDEIRKSQLGLHGNAKEYKGVFHLMSGGTQEYIVVVDYSLHQDIVFFAGGNFKLYKQVEGAYDSYRFDIRKTKSFTIDDRQFERYGKGNEVIEMVYHTDRIDLYRAHRMSAEAPAMQMTGSFLMKKEGEGITDLRGLKFLSFKKGFAKWIMDCPALAQKVSDQKYKRNESDLIAIADEYNLCQ